MTIARRIRLAGSMALICLALQTAAAQTLDELDVHQLEQTPEKYLDRELRVVGRFASAGAGRMRLVGSKIEFQLGPEIHLFANPQYVELVGRLEKRRDKLIFRTQRLSKIPPESQRFDERKQLLSKVNYPVLYQLSDWARQRAEWYDDAELLQRARRSWALAFRWEEEEIVRRGFADELLALATRGQQHDIESGEVARMRYRALTMKEQRLRPGDTAARHALADQVAELLPGAARPFGTTLDLSEAEQIPLNIYEQAAEALRHATNRALYVRLVRDALLSESKQADSDLAALMRRASELAPEDAELGRELKRLELERRAAGLANLSRRDALVLFGEFEQLEFDERARDLKQRWLAGRQSRLDRGDVEDRVALARDYWHLLRAAETAESLLREALAISPSSDAEAAFAELGFVKSGQGWRRPAEVSRLAPTADDDLVEGSPEQAVRQRLGTPDSVARSVGAGWMVELWRYEGPPKLYVYLRRSAATGQASVVRIVAP